MSALSAISRFFRPAPDERQAARLYIALVEQSRNSFFYLSLGVPDSLDGRFDLILLHLALTVRRLRQDERPETAALSQALIEIMLADMDRSLREMGVGDMGVGKRVRKMGNALFGRMKAYDTALAAPDDHLLIEALARNVYGTTQPDAQHLVTLADYVRHCVKLLEQCSDDDLLESRISWPAQ